MDEYEFKLHETEEIALRMFECFVETMEETGMMEEIEEIEEDEYKDEPMMVRIGSLILKGYAEGLKGHSD